MIDVRVSGNFEEVIAKLNAVAREHVPTATKNTLNSLAKTAQGEAVQEMRTRFDRPTPWVLKSMFIKGATRTRMTASVFLKDYSPGGKQPYSAAELLTQEFSGGGRIQKRLERLFTRVGLISSNEYLVPGAGAQLDMYGNMSRGQVQKITSQMYADLDQWKWKSDSRRSRKKRVASAYFWSRGGRLARGVWARYNFAHGSAIKPVLLVVSHVHYRKLIDMQKIGDRVVDRDFNYEFDRQLGFAIARAR